MPAALKLQLGMTLNGASVRTAATDALFARLAFVVEMEEGA